MVLGPHGERSRSPVDSAAGGGRGRGRDRPLAHRAAAGGAGSGDCWRCSTWPPGRCTAAPPSRRSRRSWTPCWRASVLAYAAGHYRLLSLAHSIFPVDVRRPPPPPGGGKPSNPRGSGGRRSCRVRGSCRCWRRPRACGRWASLCSGWRCRRPTRRWTFRAGLWRGLLLIFLVGLTAAVLWGAAAYLHWATARPEEHLLYLQDQAWRETRREQNRINRFLTWARLRAQRRKEKS